MSLLPKSRKPIDLDVSRIKNADDAAIVIAWLDSAITDMQHQILQHLTESTLNMDWLGKIRVALRGTIATRFQIAEMRARMMDSGRSRAEIFMEVVLDTFDGDDVRDVLEETDKRLRDTALSD